MKDIWTKQISLEDTKAIISIVMDIRRVMYDKAFYDYLGFRTEASDDDSDKAFDCGFMAGVIAAVAYLKEGDPHDGE